MRANLTAPATPWPKHGTNEPILYGTYITSDATERALWIQRVEGRVCLTDSPAPGARGRCHRVDDELTSWAELTALADDYLAQAETQRAIPRPAASLNAAPTFG